MDAGSRNRFDEHLIAGVLPLAPPVVLGHEGAGTVLEIGAAVGRVGVGDRVICSFRLACGGCWFCLHDQSNLCTSTEGANTNSTGLAAAALGAVGAERRAANAAAWIRRLQGYSPKPCRTGLTPERGAIAYDRLGFIAGVTDGITDETADQWNRAHAQALLALPWADLNRGAPTLTAPRRAVQAEGTVRLRVRNLEAGERVCVFVKGFRQETATTYLSKRGRDVALPVPTPAGSAMRVYRLKALSGTDRAVVRVRAE